MAQLVYLTPFGQRKNPFTGNDLNFDSISSTIRSRLLREFPELTVVRTNEDGAYDLTDMLVIVQPASLVICDITGQDPNCLYELGYAHGLGKPVLLISERGNPVPWDLEVFRVLPYDSTNLDSDFLTKLSALVKTAVEQPTEFTVASRSNRNPRNVFISYSHKDKSTLDRLLVHLKPLTDSGLVQLWVDTSLQPGDKWKQQIESRLRHCSVAILLISPDFLASDFIVRNELPPILRRVKESGTTILPIIVSPCRYARDASLSSFQSVNSPDNPLALMSEAERDKALDQVARILEDALSAA
jgi:hypothetical protein